MKMTVGNAISTVMG